MRVKNVKYIEGYKLLIQFNDNKKKVVDLEKMIYEYQGVFKPLRNVEYFKKVFLDDCQISICWPNGADICPDLLYTLGKDLEKKPMTPKKDIRKKF